MRRRDLLYGRCDRCEAVTQAPPLFPHSFQTDPHGNDGFGFMVWLVNGLKEGFSLQERGRHQEADVLMGEAIWPVRPHGPQTHGGKGYRPHCLSHPVGQGVCVPCEGCCIFRALSVALLKRSFLRAEAAGRILLPVSLGCLTLYLVLMVNLFQSFFQERARVWIRFALSHPEA